jgi:hypothetical protein
MIMMEEFRRRKCRPLDNGSPAYSSNICPSMFIIGNAVVNNQLQYKYSQRIKDFLENK